MNRKKYGKKGATGGGIVAVVLVGILFLAMFGYFGFKLVGQSTVGGGTVTTTADGTTVAKPLDVSVVDKTNTVTLRLKAQDVEGEPAINLQGLPIYCRDKDKLASILGANTGTTSLAADTVSIPSVGVGSSPTCVAFNNSYYGDEIAYLNLIQPTTDNLKAHRIAGALEPTFFNENDIAYSVNAPAARNATAAGSSSSYTYSRVKIKNNQSNSMVRLAGVAFDTVTSANVTNIEFSGFAKAVGVEGSGTYGLTKGTLPQRLITSGYNYLWAFNDGGKPYIELRGQDYVETGGLTLKSGSGCTAFQAPETVTVAFVDWNNYQSQSAATPNLIKEGMENDAPTPADVGMSDVTRAIFCVSSEA